MISLALQTNFDGQRVLSNLRQTTHSYLEKSNLQSLIIGQSGGIDSALTTAIVRPICDELGIKLIGRSITIETNSIGERARAEAIGRAFCHDFREVDLTDLYLNLRDTIEEENDLDTLSKQYKLRVGNIKVRMRMIYLYNLAQQHRGMVLSTDNMTEFMLGFWTLHGDVGDFNPLYGLWKTEVYELAHYVVSTLSNIEQKESLRAAIGCIPTDGLGISSSDVEQLGAADYDEVDRSLTRFLVDGIDDINSNVITRHHSSAFKRTNPYLISREQAFEGAI